MKEHKQSNSSISRLHSFWWGRYGRNHRVLSPGASHTMNADPINDWELTTTSKAINIVIIGKVGHGKSATGNSILGSKAFVSKLDSSRVTCSSNLQRIIRKDGRIINVIDTPGNAHRIIDL
ncbi:immune-associated nucleotide-binding protein 9-like [Dendrobium catenatum]|uniref:immune-associated nucleotide-binding protein 9-like n=1 Tax=Dendrobium catenatum TaxID=906689 RepID=UPI0009F50564|nr:immune-associated nucleotide-binding protein 9-like [Dendrobium catenatum]XP_028549757.1 immune-associated nucleotide-binding protein 9-like [Dendrobium catenatum]